MTIIWQHKDYLAHRRFDTVDGSTCITDPIKLYPKNHIFTASNLMQHDKGRINEMWTDTIVTIFSFTRGHKDIWQWEIGNAIWHLRSKMILDEALVITSIVWWKSHNVEYGLRFQSSLVRHLSISLLTSTHLWEWSPSATFSKQTINAQQHYNQSQSCHYC